MSTSADAAHIVAGGEQKTQSALQKILDKKTSVKVAADVVVSNDKNKPRGMHRELYALVGGTPPLVNASTGYTAGKAKLLARAPAAKWKWTPFKNGARKDDLRLSHWVKEGDGRTEYAFTKFNKVSRMPRYSRDDYVKYLTDDEWTEHETAELIKLCDKFDLRFVVVFDRYNKAGISSKFRTMEDIKHRFYEVFFKIAQVRRDAFLRQLQDGAGSEWPKLEVRHLFQLAVTYDGRFADIIEHFNKAAFIQKQRTVEELKDKYYKVWQEIAKATGVRQNDLTYRYDTDHETQRKDQLRKLGKRTFLQINEEALLIQEVKQINQYKKDYGPGTATRRLSGENKAESRKRKTPASHQPTGAPERLAKDVSIRPIEPTTTHLRSSMVHRSLPLKAKQLLQVGTMAEEHGISEFPLATARVDVAFDSCRKIMLEHLQRQALIDHYKHELSHMKTRSQRASR